ncbi:hypothetical protein M2447_001997 [Ereboglobus sp. PH5-10]|nr:hypothetical protein [Ereboglobus sp. PH5-10]
MKINKARAALFWHTSTFILGQYILTHAVNFLEIYASIGDDLYNQFNKE